MRSSLVLAALLASSSTFASDAPEWLRNPFPDMQPKAVDVLSVMRSAHDSHDMTCHIEHGHAPLLGESVDRNLLEKQRRVPPPAQLKQAGKHMALAIGSTSSQIDVPADSAVANIAIEVPAGARWMRVEAESNNDADIGLLVRGLSEFSANDGPQYVSVGNTGFEHLTVSQAATPALRPGNWYIALDNRSQSDTTVSLNVEVSDQRLPPLQMVVDFNDSECENPGAWSDSRPFSPVGGNNASTLGQARRNAFLHALELIGEELRSPLTIPIRACWADLADDDGNFSTLAQAGPTLIIPNSPGLAEQDVWYSIAPAVNRAGTDYCRLNPDASCDNPLLRITFNDSADPDGSGYYYGLNPPGSGEINRDFVTLAMHEIAHGLGFLSLMDLNTGELAEASSGNRLADIYTLQTVRKGEASVTREFTPLIEMSPSERLAAARAGNDLRWVGPSSLYHDDNPNYFFISNRLINAFPMNAPSLYAPGEIAPGSSFSHFAQSSGYDLMRPRLNRTFNTRTLGLAQQLLADVGWGDTASHVNSGFYFDPTLNGHGFDLYQPSELSSMLFYTFDEAGRPEWRVIAGPVNNRQLSGESIRYENAGDLESVALGGGTVESRVRLTLVDYRGQRICEDADVARDPTAPLYVLEISTADEDNLSGVNQLERYCVQPFNNDFNAVADDFTGSWFDNNEPGWGFSIQTLRVGDRTDVAAVVYYYDTDGNPRWAIGQAPFEADEPIAITMNSAVGYGRGQAPVDLGFSPAGEILLTLSERTAFDDGGSVTVDVEYQGAEGGVFQRNNVPIRLVP